MSFDMRYPNRKDWRQPYHGCMAWDAGCRPHGGCPWCEAGRKHAAIRRAPADADDQVRAAFEGLSWYDLEELASIQRELYGDYDEDYAWLQDGLDDWDYTDEHYADYYEGRIL